MRVLSIDPGYDRCGIAVIEKTNSGEEFLVFSECIQTNKKDFYDERLLKIGTRIENIISKYSPTVLSVEKLFFNTNQKTATKVSGVVGVVLYIAKKGGLKTYEYTPLQIKVAITGYGRSDKRQVMLMIPKLINIKKEIKLDDEWDAIAVGLTCLASEKFI